MKGKKSSSTKSVKENIENLAKYLTQDARKGNTEHALQLLDQNKDLITSLGEDQSKIIEYLYTPYSTAYDRENLEFCLKYEEKLNELTGLPSALFSADEL